MSLINSFSYYTLFTKSSLFKLVLCTKTLKIEKVNNEKKERGREI